MIHFSYEVMISYNVKKHSMCCIVTQETRKEGKVALAMGGVLGHVTRASANHGLLLFLLVHGVSNERNH